MYKIYNLPYFIHFQKLYITDPNTTDIVCNDKSFLLIVLLYIFKCTTEKFYHRSKHLISSERAIKVDKYMREQTAIVANGGKKIKVISTPNFKTFFKKSSGCDIS